MKPREIMTWAGPMPPDLAEPFGEALEVGERMTFAGPLRAGATGPVAVTSEPICWAGPLPAGRRTVPSRTPRKVPAIGFARAPRTEAKA